MSSVNDHWKYGIRFENNEQAEAFIYQLSEEVMRRLQSISMCGRSLTLKIMKRDPSAPVEAPKVAMIPTYAVHFLTTLAY